METSDDSGNRLIGLVFIMMGSLVVAINANMPAKKQLPEGQFNTFEEAASYASGHLAGAWIRIEQKDGVYIVTPRDQPLTVEQ